MLTEKNQFLEQKNVDIVLQRIFGKDVYNSEFTFKKTDDDQSNLLTEIMNFKKKIKDMIQGKNKKKQILCAFLRVQKTS